MLANDPIAMTRGEPAAAVWIVDDDRSIRWVLEKALSREGIPFRSFASAQEAAQALQHDQPQVLVSDIRMPGETGLELLASIKARHPRLPVIIMTAYSDLDSAVSAFRGGAFEYLPKPFDVDHAVALIRRASADVPATTAPASGVADDAEMLGQAPAMQEVFRAIGRLSHSHATVLVTGESGTGKELVARALHRHSPRASAPFVAINTAAIPKDLLESELFGHERGAFTGAQSARRGRFEQAEGGTLFLDEIGDMPPDLQVRLLRVLSDSEYYRVGGHAPLKANVRIIAATHQNLDERVRQGLFREDLMHRLNVVRLRLPPLRERPEDVEPLARALLTRTAGALGRRDPGIADDALAALRGWRWPGNVRELGNVLERALVLRAPGATGPISADEVSASLDDTPREPAAATGTTLASKVDALERAEIESALRRARGVKARAAQALGLSRPTLDKKMSDLDIDLWRKQK